MKGREWEQDWAEGKLTCAAGLESQPISSSLWSETYHQTCPTSSLNGCIFILLPCSVTRCRLPQEGVTSGKAAFCRLWRNWQLGTVQWPLSLQLGSRSFLEGQSGQLITMYPTVIYIHKSALIPSEFTQWSSPSSKNRNYQHPQKPHSFPFTVHVFPPK